MQTFKKAKSDFCFGIMELQNIKFGRSLRDSLLHGFLEATETFFSKSHVRVHNVRQITVELS